MRADRLLEENTMRIAARVGATGLGLGLAALAGGVSAMAQTGLSGYQGAWLAGGPDCAEVYSPNGKGSSFKKPVDIFAPAFIVSGNRLKTPQASCRIKSIKPAGTRQVLVLDCTNIMAGHEVKVLMATFPGGSLKRYFNEQDTAGSEYQRCSR
jgi:hypothetical protein